jgi:hypothetical protein
MEAINNFLAMVDAWVLSLGLALLMAGAWFFGLRMGRYRRAAGRDDAGAGKVEDASLAILGLLLAFTFAMAITKHEQRRAMVLADSNAIGDFYSAADVLPEPTRRNLQQVIRDYVTLRLKAAEQAVSDEQLEQFLQQFGTMHNRMSELVRDAVNATPPTPVANMLVLTLNGLTSAHAARLMAAKDRLPGSVVILLTFASITCAALVGRQQGTAGRADMLATGVMILLVCLMVLVTLDLNQPRRGTIRVSQEPLHRLLDSMGGAVPSGSS